MRATLLLILPVLFCSCSGDKGKPDPLHSVQDKQILKRSTGELPEWVARPAALWLQGGMVVFKIVSEGQTSLSNALYQATLESWDKARLVLHDHLRDRWLTAAAAQGEKDASLVTALALHSLLTTNVNSLLSNALSPQGEPYWELWQRPRSGDTIRAFSVYRLLEGKKEIIEALLKKLATGAPLTNGSPAFSKALGEWLQQGPLTHEPPQPAARTNN